MKSYRITMEIDIANDIDPSEWIIQSIMEQLDSDKDEDMKFYRCREYETAEE